MLQQAWNNNNTFFIIWLQRYNFLQWYDMSGDDEMCVYDIDEFIWLWHWAAMYPGTAGATTNDISRSTYGGIAKPCGYVVLNQES